MMRKRVTETMLRGIPYMMTCSFVKLSDRPGCELDIQKKKKALPEWYRTRRRN
jgi:hypothetical protein